MTLEERITQLEQQLADEQVKVKNQNSYITKLELQLKDVAGKNGGVVDPYTQQYLEKNMRRDTINEGIAEILKDVSTEVFKAIEPDFMDFLNKFMTKEKTRVDFVTDSFNLVYGRCLRIKDHPLHLIGKGPTTPGQSTPPAGTPAQPQIGSNQQSIERAQRLAQQQAPMMTGADGGAAPGVTPPGGETQVKSTKEAFKSLKSRFGQ